MLRTATPAERRQALTLLQQAFQALPSRQVEPAMAGLRSEAGLSEPAPVGDRRALDPSELVRLAAVDGVEVGAHTRNHPNLAHLPPDLVDEEIVGSKTDLEDCLGQGPHDVLLPIWIPRLESPQCSAWSRVRIGVRHNPRTRHLAYRPNGARPPLDEGHRGG